MADPATKPTTATLHHVAFPQVSDRVGQVLGGRYRLVTLVGTGASASVYLGEDVTLQRRVAVKVLHPALADDEAFLRRFRAEAQVAASLNHPSVFAVHDWGQDGVTPYLVTEFLAGGSLRSMLDRNGPLQPSQALLVGLEAARGLAYAHRRQLVHRDIKPANLLFDDEARLRIADFGLARALAEAAWTEPMGAVLGTARYASPEQARGETLDGRSDVYALAVVLVEAVTGTVPFASDTTLGTLMARVDAELPVPDGLGPLGDVLAAAGAPVASDRPDADELAAALLDVARHYPAPNPLPVTPIPFVAPDATPVSGPGGASPNTGGPGVHDDTEVGLDVAAPVGVPPVDGGSGSEAVVAEPFVAPRRRRRWPFALVAVLLAAAGLGAWWWTSVRVVATPVPDLGGVAVAVAESAAADAGWDLRRSESFDGTVPAGSVISQDPTAGTELAEGGVLSVVVSRGPPPVPLPDGVVGVPLAEAEARLAEVGLATGVVNETYSEDVERGVVLSAEVEPGVEVPFGEQVDLVVSAGPEPRTVPQDLFGRALDEVRSALEALGLPIGSVSEAYSESVQAGSVISVAGAGSRVDRGTPVDLQVSLGPPLVTVPDVTGLSVQQAAGILENAGLVVTSTTGSPTRPVASTNPSAGTSVRRGSSVTITTR